MRTRPNIAIVEDDEAMREALADLVQVMGLSCQCFFNAEACLKAENFSHFDCLLTDIRMPGMGGLELVRRVKLIAPQIPVIVITSHQDTLTEARVLEYGAIAFLKKPLADSEIVKVLSPVLDYDFTRCPSDDVGTCLDV